MALSYGEADLDSLKFVELCREKKFKEQAFFEYGGDGNNKFKAAIFISNTMRTYAQFFTDFVLIDTTYKRKGN